MKVSSVTGSIHFSNKLEYIVKQKQQQDMSRACFKQYIQGRSKRAKKRLRRWSHWPAEAETLSHFSTVHYYECRQHCFVVSIFVAVLSQIGLTSTQCILIQFMVAVKCICCFVVCLFSSTPKWSALSFKSFQSDLRHKLAAEAYV